MWFEDHPYITIYLAGSVLVVILTLFKLILFWFVAWITKENILHKNTRKILAPDKRKFTQKTGIFVGVVFFEATLSWINVLVAIWQIFSLLFKVLREALSTVPEEVKLLRFPLWNNPYMTREAVWAHLFALTIKAGNDATDQSQLRLSLEETAGYYHDFNRETALSQLDSLNVANSDVIKFVLVNPSGPYEDSAWDEDITEDC